MDKNIALDFVLRKKIVRKYLDNMKVDSNHRFKSWEHCYKAFGNQTKEDDELALHLAFYLASWGKCIEVVVASSGKTTKFI